MACQRDLNESSGRPMESINHERAVLNEPPACRVRATVRARSFECGETAWLNGFQPGGRTGAHANERQTLPLLPRHIDSRLLEIGRRSWDTADENWCRARLRQRSCQGTNSPTLADEVSRKDDRPSSGVAFVEGGVENKTAPATTRPNPTNLWPDPRPPLQHSALASVMD